MKTANYPRDIITGKAGFSFPFEVTKNDWLISICSRNDEDAHVEKKFGKILFLKFNDCPGHQPGALTKSEAEYIANFIKKAKGAQANVWVNCQAGICRSGAIVCLLMDLGWEYADSSWSPGRIPNHHVYDTVRKFFPELKQSWDKREITVPESGADPSIWTPVSQAYVIKE